MLMGMSVMGNKGMVPMVPGTSSVLMNPMPPMMRPQMTMPAGKDSVLFCSVLLLCLILMYVYTSFFFFFSISANTLQH